MRAQTIRTLERQFRPPAKPGQCYFRNLDGGPLHPLEHPEVDLGFDEIQRTDGPLSPMRFSTTSIGGFELEEYAMAIGYHGLHLDLNESEFWRGAK
jgi:hypothetical protein